jgi:hypothetical protein
VSEETTFEMGPMALPASIPDNADYVRAVFREGERTVSLYLRRVDGVFSVVGRAEGELP